MDFFSLKKTTSERVLTYNHVFWLRGSSYGSGLGLDHQNQPWKCLCRREIKFESGVISSKAVKHLNLRRISTEFLVILFLTFQIKDLFIHSSLHEPPTSTSSCKFPLVGSFGASTTYLCTTSMCNFIPLNQTEQYEQQKVTMYD